MPYKSQISFTLDTVCPFTYLAKKRLDKALKAHNDPKVEFNVVFKPYQLNPKAPIEGEDKWNWYLNERFQGSEETMSQYISYMTSLGQTLGITFSFKGTMGNTFEAHRLIQHIQSTRSPVDANTLIDSLYKLYFEQEKPPASKETLIEAASSIGMSAEEVVEFLDSGEGVQETKGLIREQVGNGVDSVPTVTFEGRRRDMVVVGAKEEGEYEKVIQQIIKEL